jgi:hypothetical protein
MVTPLTKQAGSLNSLDSGGLSSPREVGQYGYSASGVWKDAQSTFLFFAMLSAMPTQSQKLQQCRPVEPLNPWG